MDTLIDVLEYIALGIGSIALIIIIWGIDRTVMNYPIKSDRYSI